MSALELKQSEGPKCLIMCSVHLGNLSNNKSRKSTKFATPHRLKSLNYELFVWIVAR